MRPSRNVLRNTAVVLAALLLSWGLFEAAMFFEARFTSFGRSYPAYAPSFSTGQLIKAPTGADDPFDTFMKGMTAMLTRIAYVYIPVIAAVVTLLVGLLARNWHWTWLPSSLAQSLVAVAAVAVHGTAFNVGVPYSFLILGTSAVLATLLVRYRERPGPKPSNPCAGDTATSASRDAA